MIPLLWSEGDPEVAGISTSGVKWDVALNGMIL